MEVEYKDIDAEIHVHECYQLLFHDPVLIPVQNVLLTRIAVYLDNQSLKTEIFADALRYIFFATILINNITYLYN